MVLALLIAAAAAAQATPETPQGPVTVRADGWEYVRGSVAHYFGNVEVLYQDITITCEDLELDQTTMELVARGDVVLDQGPQRLTASEIRYNLKTKKGVFLQAAGDLDPTYHFSGDRIEKLDATHYKLHNATFTTCEPEPRPPWQFHVRKALLEQEGYGRFYGAAIRVKGVPVLYVPYLLWPVKKERASGLLVPSVGYSDRRGAYLGNALYLALGRSYDTTILLDTYSEGYYGIGNEWRWAPRPDAYGEVDLYTIRDADTESWEWKVDGSYRQDDLFGFRLLAEVHDLSDIDFFQEFERTFDQNTLRSLFSQLYLTRSWGPSTLNIRSDRRLTFLDTADIELVQAPEVELRVRPTRVGRSSLYWSLVSSANLFDVDRGGDLAATYGRFDLYPKITYSLPTPAWLSVSPSIGGRGTYYTARLSEDRRSYVEDGIDRTYAEVGVDIVGPSFSRVFNKGFGPFEKLKHLIEPRLEYRFVSDPEELELIPRFDEVDSTLVTNRVRVSLINRLFARVAKEQSAREIASLELYQEYSFSDPLNRAIDGRESQRGPLNLAARLNPSRSLFVDARVGYDTLYDNLRSTSLSTSVAGRDKYVNLTWYQGYIPSSGERSSSQVRIATGLGRSGKPLRLDLHVSYDIETEEFQQQRVILAYTADCWGITAEYRDLRFGLYPSRDYRISISFKGIGQMLEIQGGLGDMNK